MKSTQLIIFSLLVSCLFCVTSLKAEDKYRSGFIITNSNDTVRGFIQQYNVNVYTKCNFKTSIDSKATVYSPNDIVAYRFDDGKFYISKDAPLESGTKKLFLEYLIKGKASIYFMHDDTEHYFIEKDNKPILELSESQKFVRLENGNLYYKEPAYKGRLKYMLADCPEIFSEIDHSLLMPSKIISLAKDYHNKVCNTEQCIIYERSVKPVKVQISIVGGVALNTFEIGSVSTNSVTEGIIGCKFDFENLFFSREKSTIQLGLLFQYYSSYILQFALGSDEYYANNYNTTLKVDLNTFAVKIPIIYKYTFSLGKIRPYIGAGFTNVFVVSNNNYFSIPTYSINSGLSNFPFYEGGVIGVIGTKFMLNNKHALNVEFNYEYSQEFKSYDSYFNLKNHNIAFMLGYTL